MILHRSCQRFLGTVAILLTLSVPAGMTAVQNAAARTRTVPIKAWLVAGPLASPLPAYSEAKGRPFGLSDLLQFEPVDVASLSPQKGVHFPWPSADKASWGEMAAGEKGISLAPKATAPETAYLASFLDASRWIRERIAFQSSHPFQAYLDGHVIAVKNKADKPDTKGPAPDSRVFADLKLEPGEHLLIVKTLFDPAAGTAWAVDAALESAERFGPEALTVSTAAKDRMSIKHLLDGPKVSFVSMSPDGEYVALSMRQSLPPSDDSESWAEVYRAADGGLVRSFRCPGSNGSVGWAGAGKKFSVTTYDKAGGTIWLADLADGSLKPILSKVVGLGRHVWSHDGAFLVYEVTEDPDKDIEGVKRLRGLEDRQPGFRSRSYLYRLTVPGGVRERLTAGDLSANLNGISPDGKRILVARAIPDYKVRPYSQTELSVLNLETLESRQAWKGSWLEDAQWSPDGKSLLMLGGPTLFGEIGMKVSRGMVPNDYDIQAYIYNLESRQAKPLTRDFDPSVDQAFFGSSGDTIYFLTTDKASRHLYRYSVGDGKSSRIPCGADVIEQLSLARLKPAAAAIASEPNVPPRAYLVDLDSAAVRLLRDPGAEGEAGLRFGRVESWTFRNKRGLPIEGSVYYPPDFDPTRKYPCIVNYYGGTTPITLQFGGRYPKELYAALGYIVYVLQPSGAIGYGQNFSALHVNDWGMIVAEEIIDGVKKFLAEHPFVDAPRVGCIGASYGGFMTELLLTKTNMFAAAVSHAGISSIASYWGEGYWGYSYSAVATANSFPWNRRDIYINQSPLFSADKITTPLLLLHGSADTNVPPGESAQLYTALKLLGREVEYVQILDQDHLILTYNRRIVWMKTIFAWFDGWLKGQPEWWNDLYPQK